jgi:hypothetical protein
MSASARFFLLSFASCSDTWATSTLACYYPYIFTCALALLFLLCHDVYDLFFAACVGLFTLSMLCSPAFVEPTRFRHSQSPFNAHIRPSDSQLDFISHMIGETAVLDFSKIALVASPRTTVFRLFILGAERRLYLMQ